jgi:hypothetical protein|tara:strand:+ start:412 stop:576 length:165 start_codon:yes stop_codon:yes gene_type:complete
VNTHSSLITDLFSTLVGEATTGITLPVDPYKYGGKLHAAREANYTLIGRRTVSG